MDSNDLTPEQIEKASACRSPEELFELAKTEGIELTDDEMESIAAGRSWTASNEVAQCPRCGSKAIDKDGVLLNPFASRCTCRSCHYVWIQ